MANTVRQPLNVPSLENYLLKHVPQIQLPLCIEQFSFGQSNPTYKLKDSNGAEFVLRKKPPGKLAAKTLHNVEREYMILKALGDTDIPVPRVYHLCQDASIIGTPFYLMEFLNGRMYQDAFMSGTTSEERASMWTDVVNTLAKLHRVDFNAIGLGTIGRPVSYYPRQLFTFAAITEAQTNVCHPKSKQKCGPVPHMDELISFFSDSDRHPEERTALIHGDFKIDNIVFHSTEPRVIGILDWEQSTIGHPLSDLAFLITGQLLSPDIMDFRGTVLENDQRMYAEGVVPGLPSAEAVVSRYASHVDWDPRPYVPWAFAFSLLRTSVICQGIKARKMLGQSSDNHMADYYIACIGLFSTFAKTLVDQMRQRANISAQNTFREAPIRAML